jgi:hypothetical protein
MSTQTLVFLWIASAAGFAVLAMLVALFISAQKRKVGLSLPVKVPLLNRVLGRINLRSRQFDVSIESAKDDNVVVHIVGNVQCHVLPEGRGILLMPSSGNVATLSDQARNAIVEADQTLKGLELRSMFLPEVWTASRELQMPPGGEHPPATSTPGNGAKHHR